MTSDELAHEIYKDFEGMVEAGHAAHPGNLTRHFPRRAAYALDFVECDISNPEAFLFAIANDLCENLMEAQQ